MPAPLFTRQIARLFKDLVHYVFGASGTVFTNNFRRTAFFIQPNFMRAGDLHVRKLEISKSFYTHYTRVASFDLGEIHTRETTFFEVRSSPHSHHPVIENCSFQHAVKQPVKLTSRTIFLCQHYTKRLQSSADGTSWLTTLSFTFTHFVSIFSCFRAHSRSRLVASLTSR